MATKIRLMRMGKMRAPYYRIVVADARTKRDGRVIETIGKYHPKEDPSYMEVDSERALYWLGVGAQPTEAVAAILRRTGDWQTFAGEPAPPPLLTRASKLDKKAVFETAARAAAERPAAEASPQRKRRPPTKAETAAGGEPASNAAPPAGAEPAPKAAPAAGAEPAPVEAAGQNPASAAGDAAEES